MRILMINSVCGIRSTGRICTDLAQALEDRGHEVRIAYGRETVPTPFEKYAVRIGGPLGVRVHGLKARLLDASGFGSRPATERFLRWVREWDPDVIHLHNIHGYYIHVGLLFDYLRTSGKRVVWTLHDGWAFTGHCALFALKGCEKWKTGCGDCPLIRTYPAAWTDRSARNWERKREIFRGVPDLTLATPSQWLGNQAKASFLSEYPVRVIPNGVDAAVFRPLGREALGRYGLEGKRVLLGVATAWDDSKGLSDFLTLAERLEDPWRIVLVGLTEDQVRALPDPVTGLTRTADAGELAALYSAADLLLNLSYAETYPTVNLEAQACGTPVLTYDAGGSPETVFDGGGVVVPRGDLDAAEREIRALWADGVGPRRISDPPPALDKRHMIEAYRKLCEAGFSPE